MALRKRRVFIPESIGEKFDEHLNTLSNVQVERQVNFNHRDMKGIGFKNLLALISECGRDRERIGRRHAGQTTQGMIYHQSTLTYRLLQMRGVSCAPI